MIRHAIAEDRDGFRQRTGLDDSRRPLTEAGAAKMKRAARGLKQVAGPILLFATSPYTRAGATASIVVEHAGFPDPVEVQALQPDQHPSKFLEWLNSELGSNAAFTDADMEKATFAAVGHEPHLSRVIGWSLTGRDAPLGELRKGGACLLMFSGKFSASSATVEWILKADHLRRLA
ncbi:MAG: histidine phosphatase family protein [Lautropia sp.]